jgi:uncharacterized protein (DUF433 family)
MNSVWQWNTGQPSIFGGLQQVANISKKSVETQGTRFRHDPVKLVKKPNRDGSGRTIPLGKRINLQDVYEYRMSGKTWDEVAAHFKCSTKHIHEKMTDTFPELRKVYFGGKERPGNRPKDVDITAIIRDILGGMSIRQVAPLYGISHVSLGRKLKQTDKGARAVEVARNRAMDMNAAKKAEAQKRRAAA